MYYLGKIPKMTYKCFIEKLFTKWHQGGLQLTFFPIELSLCKFFSKILNLDPIFGSDVHLSIAYNFCN
jgi:hypothetical protein